MSWTRVTAAFRRLIGQAPTTLLPAPPQEVLRLDTQNVPPFEGFSHTVAEGQRLAQRCHTELPEFREEAATRLAPSGDAPNGR